MACDDGGGGRARAALDRFLLTTNLSTCRYIEVHFADPITETWQTYLPTNRGPLRATHTRRAGREHALARDPSGDHRCRRRRIYRVASARTHLFKTFILRNLHHKSSGLAKGQGGMTRSHARSTNT